MMEDKSRRTTGCFDLNGKEIFEGDFVVYHNTGETTKPEYWEPEYKVVWNAPKFTLEWIGGGKDVGSYDFNLKFGGPNGFLEKMLTSSVERKESFPLGTKVYISHDGFKGEVIGHYTTREGKEGVVLQQDGTRVVHVYGTKWLQEEEKEE